MNFELNEEQSALAESLSRLLADRYGFEKRRALVAAAGGTLEWYNGDRGAVVEVRLPVLG